MKKIIKKFKDLKEKIKNWKEKRNYNRANKNLKRQRKILRKISREMPFMASTVLSGGEQRSLDPWDQIKIYHEIGSIKSQKLHNWIIVILTLCIILLTSLQIYDQHISSQLTNPVIKINLFDQSHFNVQNLLRIRHYEDGTFEEEKEYLNFEISNFGQKSVDYMNIYGKDLEGDFEFGSGGHIKDLGRLQDQFIQIPFWSVECREISFDAKDNNQSWQFPVSECKKARENITMGEREFVIKIDCPGCEFNGKSRCYSINICIYDSYDSEESFCQKDSEYQNLKETPCPEDWWN